MKIDTYLSLDAAIVSPSGLKPETVGVSDDFLSQVDNTEFFYSKKIRVFNRLIVRKLANNPAARSRAFKAFVSGYKSEVMTENRANGGTGSHTAISIRYCVAALDSDFAEHIAYMAKCGPEKSIVDYCAEFIAKFPDGNSTYLYRDFQDAVTEYRQAAGNYPLV